MNIGEIWAYLGGSFALGLGLGWWMFERRVEVAIPAPAPPEPAPSKMAPSKDIRELEFKVGQLAEDLIAANAERDAAKHRVERMEHHDLERKAVEDSLRARLDAVLAERDKQAQELARLREQEARVAAEPEASIGAVAALRVPRPAELSLGPSDSLSVPLAVRPPAVVEPTPPPPSPPKEPAFHFDLSTPVPPKAAPPPEPEVHLDFSESREPWLPPQIALPPRTDEPASRPTPPPPKQAPNALKAPQKGPLEVMFGPVGGVPLTTDARSIPWELTVRLRDDAPPGTVITDVRVTLRFDLDDEGIAINGKRRGPLTLSRDGTLSRSSPISMQVSVSTGFHSDVAENKRPSAVPGAHQIIIAVQHIADFSNPQPATSRFSARIPVVG